VTPRDDLRSRLVLLAVLIVLTLSIVGLAVTAAQAAVVAGPGRAVVLEATCRTTVVRCAGEVTATLRRRPASATKATFARLASKRSFATTTKRRTGTVRISLSRTAYRRAVRAPARRVVLAVAATRPAKAATKVTVRLARPR
jgi:hypothetical protein